MAGPLQALPRDVGLQRGAVGAVGATGEVGEPASEGAPQLSP